MSYLVLVVSRDLQYLYSNHHITQGLGTLPPAPLIKMRPEWLLRSWIEPAARPLAFTNSSVTQFMRAPESTRTVVNRPSRIAVPILAG